MLSEGEKKEKKRRKGGKEEKKGRKGEKKREEKERKRRKGRGEYVATGDRKKSTHGDSCPCRRNVAFLILCILRCR
jgi:hypothetical protein